MWILPINIQTTTISIINNSWIYKIKLFNSNLMKLPTHGTLKVVLRMTHLDISIVLEPLSTFRVERDGIVIWPV